MADKRSKAKPSAVEQFFKPTQWEDDDWGNIELPGLSDKELHGKNWNLVTANREKAKDPGWIRKNQLSHKTRWTEQYHKRFKARMRDPEIYDKTVESNRRLAQDSDWLKKVAENNRAKRQDAEHIKKHSQGVKDRSNNNKEWIRKNCRPVDTPYGVFEKAKDVMDVYHQEHGGNRESVAVKLRNWLKSDKKPDWKYLTWEQYDELTKPQFERDE